MTFDELDTITPWFWEVVAKGERDPQRMREVLSSLSRKELQRFYGEYEWAVTEMSGKRFAKVHGDTEDIVADVAAWVASQGRDYYASVYNEPKRFPDVETIDQSTSFIGLAEQVYEERFGEEMPDASSL